MLRCGDSVTPCVPYASLYDFSLFESLLLEFYRGSFSFDFFCDLSHPYFVCMETQKLITHKHRKKKRLDIREYLTQKVFQFEYYRDLILLVLFIFLC